MYVTLRLVEAHAQFSLHRLHQNKMAPRSRRAKKREGSCKEAGIVSAYVVSIGVSRQANVDLFDGALAIRQGDGGMAACTTWEFKRNNSCFFTLGLCQ